MDLKQRIWTEIGNTIGQAMDLDDVRRYLRDSGPDVNNITEWAVLWQAVMANDRAKALICRDCQERSDSTMWIFLLRQSFESYINGWRVFMRSASQQNDANTPGRHQRPHRVTARQVSGCKLDSFSCCIAMFGSCRLLTLMGSTLQ